MRTILVPLTAGLAGEPGLDAALVLARRVNANIRAMLISPNPHSVLAYLPDVILAAGVTREIIGRGLRKRLHRRRSALMIGERATFPKPPVGVLIRALRSGRSRSVKSRPW